MSLLIVWASVAIIGLIFNPRALSDSPAGIVWTWGTWPMIIVLFVWLVITEAIEEEG